DILLDFDDITGCIPENYHGFHWEYIGDFPDDSIPVYSYLFYNVTWNNTLQPVSSPNLIRNGNGVDIRISREQDFKLKSVYLTPQLVNNQPVIYEYPDYSLTPDIVIVNGYDNDILKYSFTAELINGVMVQFDDPILDSSVNSLEFLARLTDGSGLQPPLFLLDDLLLEDAPYYVVPEFSSLIYCIIGLVTFAFSRKFWK
ncbi:MAG: hypothetical protein JW728_03830, partial [Candidatus Aureabacteria bacterium]|nr:hypothetical protein [Candidatus Auribacterota bacterium]